MSRRTDHYAGSDWYTEGERGRNLRLDRQDRDDVIRNFYTRIHPWEREQGTILDLARLNESRGLRDAMDYLCEMVDRMTNSMRDEEQRADRLYRTFDRMLDVLEQNAKHQEPVPLSKILADVGKVSNVSKSNRVLEAIQATGANGLTDRDGSDLTGVEIEVYKRIRERLAAAGSVFDSGFKRGGTPNRRRRVWVSNRHKGEFIQIQLQADVDNAAAGKRGVRT